MSAARWERLQAELEAASMTCRVSEKAYADVRRVGGRNYDERGVSRSITIQLEHGYVVTVSDENSRRAGGWLGWRVWLEDADSIVVAGAHDHPTKHRSDVVDAVRRAQRRARTSGPTTERTGR